MNQLLKKKKEFPMNRRPGADGVKNEFCRTFREELTPILLKLFQKIAEEIAESGIIGLGEMAAGS